MSKLVQRIQIDILGIPGKECAAKRGLEKRF